MSKDKSKRTQQYRAPSQKAADLSLIYQSMYAKASSRVVTLPARD